MGIEIVQDTSEPVESASLQSDNKAGRVLHLAANARVATTLHFKITQTSPGTLQGLGADTNVSIPGGAVPIALRIFGALNDATTSGTITIGLDNVTSNHFLSNYNVANAPTGLGQQTPSGVSNLFQALPIMALGQAHALVGHYTVTGTSAGGGPWYAALDYYLPDPA